MDKGAVVNAYPPVAGEFETLGAVLSGKSLARFGDGELKLMHGQGYFREPPSMALGGELLRVLRRPDPNCIVGIPTMDPNGPKYENWIRHANRFAGVLRPGMKYYSAFVTRPDSAPWIDVCDFARTFEALWRGKVTTVVSEPGNKILTAVRMSCRKLKRVTCPSNLAYSEIDRLEEESIKTKNEIVLISCGPTATCLANRLAARGLHAVDVGSAGGYLVKLLLRK